MTTTMNLKYEYECALSGITVPGELAYAEDGLDDMPQGWFEVKLSRRAPNPKWVLIQHVKRAMLEALISQYPKEVQAAQGTAVRLQLDAQFFGLENATPPYVTEVETVYLSPPALSEDVADAVNQLRELIGLDPLEEDADEDDEDEEVVEKVAAVEASPAVVEKKSKKALPSTGT